jgi:hypothetical protein
LFAVLRIIREQLGLEENLLTNGEYKVSAAIHTMQSPINELHDYLHQITKGMCPLTV